MAMQNLFFGDSAAWFTVPAIIGSVFFLFRCFMLLVGAGAHDIGLDLHADAHADLHGGDLHGDGTHNDSAHAFQVLSVQSIAAFLMGFGWAGLAAYRNGWHWSGVMVVALVCGGAMVWMLGLLLKGMADLQSSGNIPMAAALDHEGDVYVTVPDGGRGQVRVTVEERQRIYNAVTRGEDLPTGTRVRVVRVNDDNTLTVARA
jgi:membrane protein implicated in regulation of membrane protease activity